MKLCRDADCRDGQPDPVAQYGRLAQVRDARRRPASATWSPRIAHMFASAAPGTSTLNSAIPITMTATAIIARRPFLSASGVGCSRSRNVHGPMVAAATPGRRPYTRPDAHARRSRFERAHRGRSTARRDPRREPGQPVLTGHPIGPDALVDLGFDVEVAATHELGSVLSSSRKATSSCAATRRVGRCKPYAATYGKVPKAPQRRLPLPFRVLRTLK